MMTAPTTSSRRSALFGGVAPSQGARPPVDLEALEQENDAGIEALGERVGLLKSITGGIHSEVQDHHRVLDQVAQGMAGVQLGLSASANKFKQVMQDPSGRQKIYIGLGTAAVLFLLYLWWR